MGKLTVAILGQPNVGKSTLFNRLIGERRAIVDPTAGVTRDRIYGETEWNGMRFHVIDTGGFMPDYDEPLTTAVTRQAELAGEEAQIIIFLVDGAGGLTPTDRLLADWLRRLGKPVVLTVNKIDHSKHESRLLEFFELGLGDPEGIGALSGRGVGDLLDRIVVLTREIQGEGTATPENAFGLAIVGVPNVGKSSFMNAILKTEKSIVTDIPGTTRDSIDSYINYLGRTIRLIDTAGLRKKSKVGDAIEYYSTIRTYRSIDECQVALLLIDAQSGFNRQDRTLADYIIDKGRGLVLGVNKWDAIEKDAGTTGEWVRTIQGQFKQLQHYPIAFMSVAHNLRLWKALQVALDVFTAYSQQIPTSELNRFVEEATRYQSPPAVQGKRISLKYATQVHRQPPIIAIFTNHPKLIPVHYKRFLENRLRERFALTGTPVKISFRQK